MHVCVGRESKCGSLRCQRRDMKYRRRRLTCGGSCRDISSLILRLSGAGGRREGVKSHRPASINFNYNHHQVSIVPLTALCICKEIPAPALQRPRGHQGRFEPISGILGKLDGGTHQQRGLIPKWIFGKVMKVQMSPAEPGEE